MTDPIADFLTRIRNAVSVGHKVVEIPGSKIKLEMTKILKEKGYILNYKFEQEGARSNIILQINGKLYTPPVKCGLLNGIFKTSMKNVSEKILYKNDLENAEKIFCVNSVRGIVEVKL